MFKNEKTNNVKRANNKNYFTKSSKIKHKTKPWALLVLNINANITLETVSFASVWL